MTDKFLEALDAEIEHFESTKHLSEKEQMKADKKWMKSKEHKRLVKMFEDALFEGFGENVDKK